MRDWQCQAHVKHYCRYHVVFVPKYRKKALFGTLRREIGAIFRGLCRQKGIELVEGYAMRDHIHMLLMIPPKFSVSNTVGFLKGKSAIQIFRKYKHVKRNFTGRHFWARGYCVSTVGLDEQMIREYIKNQEVEERRQEQIQLAGL
ncbi:IS200/IS605 family transposase [Microbulbifer sp. DLAB2-AF]|uniref:IS200/IS605 family transposase n=1 Tax=Microbulbifer sp. DLAB2-AF TaxID=3243395 RepID=UPI004039475F